MSNPFADYVRLWPSRGDELFGVTVAYFVSVALICLAGIAFVVLVIAGSCAYWCSTASCACCDRCSRDHSGACHRKCLHRVRRKRPYKRRHHVVFVLVEVTLILFAAAGLLVALIGSLDTAQGLEPIGRAASAIVRIANIAVDAIAAFTVALRNLVSLLPPNSILDGSNLDIVEAWVNKTSSSMCTMQQVLLYSDAIAFLIAIVGQGLSFSSACIVVLGLMRERQRLVTAGTLLTFLGMILTGFFFALATPVSVLMDDLCFSAIEYYSANFTGDLILTCLSNNATRGATLFMVNFTDELSNVMINRDCATFNAAVSGTLGASFAPLPVNAPFYTNFSTTAEICESALSVSIPPVLDMLRTSQLRIIQAANFTSLNLTNVPEWLIVTAEQVVLRTSQAVFRAMSWASGCGSGLWAQWLGSFGEICGAVRLGLGLIVWGTFVAAVCFVAAFIIYVSFRHLLPDVRHRTRTNRCFLDGDGVTVICLAQIFSASLIGSLSLRRVGDIDAGSLVVVSFPVCCALSGVMFVLLGLSPALFKSRVGWTARRVLWLCSAVFCLAFAILFSVIFANTIDYVVRCFGNVCERACPLLVSVTLLGIVVLSAAVFINAYIAAMCSIFVALVPSYREPHPFTGDIGEDFDLQKVQLSAAPEK